MKKRTFIPVLIPVAFVALMLTSCEKDKPITEAIIGNWEVQTEKQTYSQQNVTKFEYTYYYDVQELAFEFTSGGSVINIIDGDVFGMTTYSFSGNNLILELGDEDLIMENVSVDGNTLTWTQSGTDVVGEEFFDVEILYTATKTN